MAVETLQAFDITTGDQSGADIYVCRIRMPKTYRLVEALFMCQNLVTTGTVTATLRRATVGGPRAGSLVGTALDNTQLAANAGTASHYIERNFVLAEADKRVGPESDIFLLVLGSSNSADRYDEPGLTLKWERA